MLANGFASFWSCLGAGAFQKLVYLSRNGTKKLSINYRKLLNLNWMVLFTLSYYILIIILNLFF